MLKDFLEVTAEERNLRRNAFAARVAALCTGTEATQHLSAIELCYTSLSVLDNKAIGLLQLAAIFITMNAVLVTAALADNATIQIPAIVVLVSVLAMAAFATAAGFCLNVIKLRGDLLSSMMEKEDGDYDRDAERLNLSKSIVDRSIRFRRAWILSFAGIWLSAAAFTLFLGLSFQRHFARPPA